MAAWNENCIWQGKAITGSDPKKAIRVDFRKRKKFKIFRNGKYVGKHKLENNWHVHEKTSVNGVYYRNGDTGHVYKCTRAGYFWGQAGMSSAELDKVLTWWKYVRTDVVARPTSSVKSLSLARDGNGSHVMRATWKLPSGLADSTSGKRCSGIWVTWRLSIAGVKTPITVVQEKGKSATSAALDLSSFTATGVPKGFPKSYTRASFHPSTSRKLTGVSVTVVPYNAKGDGTNAASVSKSFTAPRAPSLSSVSHSQETGFVGATVTTDAGNDLRERSTTQYEVIVTDTSRSSGVTRTTTSAQSASTQITGVGYNATNRYQLTYTQYIKVTVRARARGYAGDSAWVSKSHVVSYPAVASHGGPSCSSAQPTGKVTLPIKTNSTDAHPVDRVVLEALVNSTAATAAAATGAEGWTTLGAVDDANCTALSCTVADVYPETDGYRSWLRVKSWHDFEEVFYRYSTPVEVKKLTRKAATAADDECAILSLTPGDDGKSMVVVCAWDEKGAGSRDDADGTQLMWSDAADAWTSTDGPEEHEFEWHDSASASSAYYYTATITVKGLDEGTAYHFRARRYKDGDDGKRTYGKWSNAKSDVPVSSPSSVVLVADAQTVEHGRAVRFSWTFDSEATQERWQLYASDGKVIASGKDALGSYTVPWRRIRSVFGDNPTKISAYVRVSTGGDFVQSAACAVRIAYAPWLTAEMDATSTAQPLEVRLCSGAACSVAAVLKSRGCSGQSPSGVRSQEEGEAVWTDVLHPTWAWDDAVEGYVATVALPGGLDLMDECAYELSATATDPSTGLKSDAPAASTVIGWAHQAPMPSEDTAVTPEDVTDDDGARHLRCRLAIVRADGYADGDVCDVYRVTQDGVDLVCRGLVPPDPARVYAPTGDSEIDEGKTYYAYSDGTYTAVAEPTEEGLSDYYELTSIASLEVVDELAPIGDGIHAYRIATRTADGDEEWRDYDYDLPVSILRIDWDGRYAEFAYDLSVGDEWAKGFEAREYLDGDVQGSWSAVVGRKASLSLDLVRAEDDLDQEAVRALAQYRGPAFVRTPDGSAYTANVEASIEQSAGSPLCAVSIDATQLSLSPRHWIDTGGA